MSDLSPAVTYSLDGDVAVISLDDGKANALRHAVLDALDEALTRARGEARAVARSGRELCGRMADPFPS